MQLRRALHARGLRYRVDVSPVAGIRSRADIVFTRAKLAVYVDGCFWHGCPLHATQPMNNAQWWAEKLAANVRRDRANDEKLANAGWRVERAWEHEDPEAVAERIVVAYRSGRRTDASAR